MSKGDIELESNGLPLEEVGSVSESLDRTLRLLAHHRRRAILELLIEVDDGGITFSRLVRAIARSEGEDDSESIRIDLHHCHLPRLADAGVVEYDHRSGAIRYRSADDIEAVLASLRGRPSLQ
ncbi:ArsR family transcriptional regulator [Halomarina halobia]|uniref:ArsR family transcriptional regulator n=1 Tax=Halomarina halobia TaxID=3033386 RepID=A0ABD6A6Q1_9EURY|nr:hypothetical protein [Halomarina sp. PSR21]